MGWLKKLFGKDKKTWYEDSFGELSEDKIERLNELSNKLLADRIIMIGTPIDDSVAQTVVAQMLFLEQESPDKDISLYLNSPGGSITASFAIYDTIKFLKPDVTTVCLGQAAGTAAFLLAAGAKGKRFIQSSSRIIIYKPKISADAEHDVITLQKELVRMRELIVNTLVEETKMTPEKAQSIIERDTILSADEAIELGFADEFFRKKN